MQNDNAKPLDLSSLIAPATAFAIMLIINGNRAALHARLEASGYTGMAESLQPTVGTLVWLTGAWLVSRLIIALILNPLAYRKTGSPAPRVLGNLLSATVLLIAVFLIVKIVFDRPIGGLVATSGIVTVVIGVAIRDMIADFFSGLALTLEQPYQIGDWVELAPGRVARVTEANWRATRLITLSNKTIVVPNNDFASREFINYSKPAREYRESIAIVLNYTADAKRIENILLSAVLSTEGLMEGGNHNVRIKEFTERGVVYDIRFWINDYQDCAALRHRVAGRVLQYLNQAGVPIPYAQHEILLTRNRRPRQERRINARRLLSRIEWLATLTDEELDTLAPVAIDHEFKAGEQIVSEGEIGASLFVLVEGMLEVSRSNSDGAEVGVGTIKPGQAFGEMSFLTGSKRLATVIAATDGFLLEVRREDFQPIIRARPEIANELGRIMAHRASASSKALSDQNGGDNEESVNRAQQIARKITNFFGLN